MPGEEVASASATSSDEKEHSSKVALEKESQEWEWRSERMATQNKRSSRSPDLQTGVSFPFLSRIPQCKIFFTNLFCIKIVKNSEEHITIKFYFIFHSKIQSGVWNPCPLAIYRLPVTSDEWREKSLTGKQEEQPCDFPFEKDDDDDGRFALWYALHCSWLHFSGLHTSTSMLVIRCISQTEEEQVLF